MPYLTDEIALKHAAKFNLEKEYKTARKQGYNIIDALDYCNIINEEFIKEYDGYELPEPTSKERLHKLWIDILYPLKNIYYKIRFGNM